MSSEPTPADKNPRDELRAKIEASERRIAQRTLADQAREAAEAATDYAKANPLKVIGGAIIAGLIVGAMTKPGRRVAKRAATGAVDAVGGAASGAARSVSGAAKKRGSAFTALIADAVIAYGIKFIDEAMSGARKGQDVIEDVGDTASAKARELRREASYLAGSAADKSRNVARRTRRRAERAVRDLTDRVSN
ncbi:hypothetical protein [uncultured Erythrobacter sp.]|uniref:hypothetical protein n=1 Tax=uncultured Erythrobacter sp. TaxID=263913 RepID=UPI0026208A7C|nr:hypothetical protein [uncultured Erythrobacter sp.]